MQKLNLLIPSARVVSEELQNLGKLPAVIYPVNGHIVFSYLYKQYSSKCKINVLCYENAEKVHKKLGKYKDINVVDIPNVSDLAHTIYCGIKSDDPMIINFGDTIVMDNIFEHNGDCFYYANDYVSDKWTFFSIKNGELEEIYDKRKFTSTAKEKLFVGVFYIANPVDFKKCLEKAFLNEKKTISTFYQALKDYSSIHHLSAIETSKWYDIGHADKYYNTKLEVQAREFNHISIDKDRGILTKYSEDKDKFIGEIKWYLKLPSDIEYLRPRIFDYSIDYNNPYISMEYYAYHTIHELFLNGDLNINQWEMIFERIRFICHDMRRYKVEDRNIIPSLHDMYFTKTINRLNSLKKDKRFMDFFNKPINVNGINYISLNSIIDVLKNVIPEMLYDVSKFNIIHGDLCFANMMIDNNFSFIKVIDPRGKFGVFDIYGDSRYELAKLFHSVDGKYDYIIKDLFELNYSDNKIEFTIQDKDRTFDLYKVFLNVFSEEICGDLKKIELIESLLFLSMIPLHKESYNHQLVMMGTGLEILNRVVNIIEGR